MDFRDFFYFPKLKKKTLVYLDTAATSLRLKSAIKASTVFYKNFNSNVHRSINPIAHLATENFEKTRALLKAYLKAEKSCIIFTRNCTESINIVAKSLEKRLSSFSTILVTGFEHHSNFVPWLRLSKETGVKVKVVDYKPGEMDFLGRFLEAIRSEKPFLVAFSEVSNVLGLRLPILEIASVAKEVGSMVLVDAAQSAAYYQPDLSSGLIDFYCFSSHKIFAPTGVGILCCSHDGLKALSPLCVGGGTVLDVSFEDYQLAEPPYSFEAGTPPIAEVIGLGKSIEFLLNVDRTAVNEKLTRLKAAFLRNFDLSNLGFELMNPSPDTTIFSLIRRDLDLTTLGLRLGERGFLVRVGHHCAIPLHRSFNTRGSLRVSLSIYNSEEEVDQFFDALKEVTSGREHNIVVEVEASKPKCLKEEAAELAQNLKALSNEELLDYLGFHGKQLMSSVNQQLLRDEYLIPNCMSRTFVWPDKYTIFQGYSESVALSGLLKILMDLCQNKSPSEVANFNFEGFLDSISIFNVLTLNRRFGLVSIIDRIRQIAGGNFEDRCCSV